MRETASVVVSDTDDVDDDQEWVDSATARRPGLRDVLTGAGLALGAGLLIAVAAVGAVVVLVVASLGPSNRSGPGDGRHSRRLPVEISPTDGLQEGTAVRVRALRLAGAGEAIIAECAAEAFSRNRGVSACDLAHRNQVDVRDGKVLATFRVTRSIALPGRRRVDCARARGGCVLMVASVENYDRSGFAPLSFLRGPG